ncbi:MAG: hypothetical protein ACP5N7_01130, partial [Candidatus Pacearchaeota archaeon]
AGIYSKQTSDDLLEFAATLQNTTKYSEDAVISNLNLLTSLTNLDKEGLKKASKASLDLAARLGIDVDTATQMVTKSINGNSTALQKNGIIVRKGSNENERLANTLDALARFNGSAEASANTFSGAMIILSNSFGEVLEAIGLVVTKDPLIIAIIKNLATFFNNLATTIGEAKLSIIDFVISTIKAIQDLGLATNEAINFFTRILLDVGLAALFLFRDEILGFVNVAKNAIAEFVVTALKQLTTFGNALTLVNIKAKATALGLKLLTAAMTAGLFIALDFAISKFLELKDELGSVGNVLKFIGNSFKIFAAELAQNLVLITNDLKGFANNAANFLLTPINKAREALGKDPIKVEIFEIDDEKTTLKIQGIQKVIDGLEKKNEEMKAAAKKGNFADSLLGDSLEKLEALKKKQQETIDNLGKGQKGIKVGLELDNNAIDKIKSDFKNLQKSLAGTEGGELGKLKADYAERLKVINDYAKLSAANKKEANKVLEQLDLDYAKKEKDLLKKQSDEVLKIRQETIDKAKANPLGIFTGGFEEKIKQKIQLDIAPQVLGGAQGFGEAISKGAEGFADILSSGASGLLNAMAPGLGSALKPFLDMFMKGPEFVDQMLTQFIQGIPRIISNFILAIPQFFITLARESVKLVDALVREMPRVIVEFLKGAGMFIIEVIKSVPTLISTLISELPRVVNFLVSQAPQIAISFVEALIKEAPRMIVGIGEAIVKGIKDAIGGFFGGGGDDGGLLGLGFLGLATGGKIVKGGIAGKDSVPAALTPGEIVVDTTTSRDLQKFLDSRLTTLEENNQGNGNNEVTNALLVKVVDLLSRPQEVSSTVVLNNRTLADIILNLNRTNTRLA